MVAPVISGGNFDEVNKAIQMPKVLIADDGRVYNVIDWHVHAELDEMLTVSPKLNVFMDREEYFKDRPEDKLKFEKMFAPQKTLRFTPDNIEENV